MLKVLLATNNPGKLREYSLLLEGPDIELVTPLIQGVNLKVEESGATMAENAIRKATAYAAVSRLVSLADDSGLEVDALGGEPGVMSARYAGEGASDRERLDYLLRRLDGVPWERRTARFRCIIALAAGSQDVRLFQGECPGIIAFEPRGEGGFGYDPIFYLPQYGKTMAELSIDIKNRVSHRGQAARKVRPVLESLARGAKP